MIDFKEEIKRYKTINIDGVEYEENLFDAELKEIMKGVIKNFDRLSKEQYKTSNKLDEIIITLEEKGEDEELNREIKEKMKKREAEINALLKALINLADLIEDMYVYSKKTENVSLKQQVILQWNYVKSHLLQCGVTVIGNEGESFNSELDRAAEVRHMEEKFDGEILEVLKSGYMYKGKLLRKAEVIVNKTDLSEEVKGLNGL